MRNKYDTFNDGYSQGMFVMARDLGETLEFIEDTDLTKKEIVELIKRELNSCIKLHVPDGGHFASTDGYTVFVKGSKILTDETKDAIRMELMD